MKIFIRIVFLAFALSASGFCLYGYALVPKAVGFFMGYEKVDGRFPIPGTGALDQTSIAEFIFYGSVLFAAVLAFTFLTRAFGKSGSRVLIVLYLALALFVSFAGLSFFAVSLPLLAAYVDAMGATPYRISGLVYCAAFIAGQILLIKSMFSNEVFSLFRNSNI